MKQKNIVAGSLALSIFLTSLTMKVKAKTIDVPYIFEEKKYGESELGKDLMYYHIENEKQSENSPKMLLNFAIHGFEDAYDYDGKLLVAIADKIVEYYNENYDKLGTYELYVVKCSNPDGTYDGNTNNGYGRCQSNGIDLNRDFDYNHISYKNSRNYTPYAFSAKESRALRDLTKKISPNIVVDCHGWLNGYYGSYSLYQKFNDTFKMPYSGGYGSGYYSSWATTLGAEGMLLEFPWPSGDTDEFVETYANKLIEVINNLASQTLNEQQKLENSEPSIYLNGEIQKFSRSSIKIKGTNYYPIRDICEKINCTVTYENGIIKISDGLNNIELIVGSDIANVNGLVMKLKSKVFINNGASFASLRDICSFLGYSVNYDKFTNSIYVDANYLTKNLEINNYYFCG